MAARKASNKGMKHPKFQAKIGKGKKVGGPKKMPGWLKKKIGKGRR